MIVSIAVFSPDSDIFESIQRGLPYLVELIDLDYQGTDQIYHDLVLLDAELLNQKLYPNFIKKWEHLLKQKLLILITNPNALVKNISINICDFLFKPFTKVELNLRVKRALAPKSFQRLSQEYVKISEEKKELEETNIFLRQLVVTDSLTGVSNRRYLLERLQEEFLEAQRKERHISMIMIDLDFFKKINDKYGHQCGDYVLAEFASILRKNVRRREIVARYGGEEFVIALFDAGLKPAMLIAERVHKDTRNHLFDYQEQSFQITCSLGVASHPEMCHTPDWNQLLRAADAALYHAKNTGRDRICYPPEFDTVSLESAD